MTERTQFRWKALVSAPRALAVIERYRNDLAAVGCEVMPANTVERLSEEELLPLVVDVDGIICGDDRITSRVIDAAPRLRVISKWGTGIDSIDVEYAVRRGIAVRNVPGAFRNPVADTVLGYILLFARKLDLMSREMHDGVWNRVPLESLDDATLGIVGLGECGRAVARRARGFDMRILATTLGDVPREFHEDFGVELVPLARLLEESDYVTLHANLRADNHDLIGAAELQLMKPSAVIINTARGGLIDEPALIAALRERRIRGAALDVFAEEPLPSGSELRRLENVFLAPHNANGSVFAAERVHRASIQNLVDVLERA